MTSLKRWTFTYQACVLLVIAAVIAEAAATVEEELVIDREINQQSRADPAAAKELRREKRWGPCPCPRIFDPVCASKNLRFSNKCFLDCYNRKMNTNYRALPERVCRNKQVDVGHGQ
ncbi:Kazal-type serine protease inhibitor domain [Nesidiocoris tenuis]|uniref:Kazal-type serine protease inhibitor domain n=1 Tax=Nesidiocoris tenuis TaxID=355587 RepID=A0ABN7B340_9HEMI|nr:Kazal-type serine protease inhibitor domain [Nesidiocoris tenuis]